jgi:hypothetical protein
VNVILTAGKEKETNLSHFVGDCLEENTSPQMFPLFFIKQILNICTDS